MKTILFKSATILFLTIMTAQAGFGAVVIKALNGKIDIPEKYAGLPVTFLCNIQNNVSLSGTSGFAVFNKDSEQVGNLFKIYCFATATTPLNLTATLDKTGEYSLANVSYTPGASDGIVESYGASGGNTWYRLYSSGWIEQGGNWSYTGGGVGWSSGTLSFPHAFANVSDIVQYTWTGLSTVPSPSSLSGVSTSGMTLEVRWNANGVYSTYTISGSWNINGFISRPGGGGEEEGTFSFLDFHAIVWDVQGGIDEQKLQEHIQELNDAFNEAQRELEGEISTRTNELQLLISALQDRLDEAIDRQEADQAMLLNRIEDFEREIRNLAADLQYNVAELERRQADFIAQLEALESAHRQDVGTLDLKIANLDSKYAAEITGMKSDIAAVESSVAQLDAKFLSTEEQLKSWIGSLADQQNTLRQQLNLAELQHQNDIRALQAQIDAKTALIRAEHSADVKRLENSIGTLDSKYASEVALIRADQGRTDQELAQTIRDYMSADGVLQGKIDALSAGQSSLQNELAVLTVVHDRDISEIKTQMEAKNTQLEIQHNADVKLLQQSIGDLDSRYQASVQRLNSDLSRTNAQLEQLERDSMAGDASLKEQINALKLEQSALQNAIVLLATKHNDDVALLRSECAAKYELLKATHQADVNLLTRQLDNLNATYADKTSQINSELNSIRSDLIRMANDSANGDKELKEQIASLRLQQLTQQNALNNLSDTHSREITDLQGRVAAAQAELQEKIDMEVAGLRQDMLSLENQYKDADADLKIRLAGIAGKLESEVAKLSATDRDLYDRISDLREKQADYYARMEILKVTYEKDKEAIEKEIADLDAKYKREVEAVHAEILSLKEEIAALEAKHDEEVARLQGEIDSTVGKLDDEVRKIYLELAAVRNELAAHKLATQQAIDRLQLLITEVDKAVTERLQNLENRIQYAVYSDEKLTTLKTEFESRIQAKEKEIANLDLEIQDLANKGLDTSAKEETRTRLLKELLTLRNELTDIEFAIEIRHNESEFAEHEKEIESLKSELAILRESTDLQIKQLKDELLEAEEKYLRLLEEVKADAAAQSAGLQKQLDDLKAQVLAFVEALQSERKSGDAELRALLEAMDISHKTLIAQLDSGFSTKLEKLKFEQDTQFENLRSSLNNLAYQQHVSAGGSGSSYSIPSTQVQDVPADSRDLRVSPDAALDSLLN